MTAPGPVQSATEGARFLVVPFDIHRGDAERFTLVLDFLCAHPGWVSIPVPEDQLRRAFAELLTDPKARAWEVWHGSELVGMLYLGEIRPLISGVVHFIFLDRELRGKRDLLQTWFSDCFRTYDFQSLVAYVPEFVDTLLSFYRSKLKFRFQGEETVLGHKALTELGMENPQVWVARQGSRRERAHWYKGEWHDVHVLRLLRTEHEARMGG